MRHSVENYIIFILLFSVNCIILYPKYFSYGEKRANTQQFIALAGFSRTISTTCFLNSNGCSLKFGKTFFRLHDSCQIIPSPVCLFLRKIPFRKRPGFLLFIF